jgi:hypothetical protein
VLALKAKLLGELRRKVENQTSDDPQKLIKEYNDKLRSFLKFKFREDGTAENSGSQLSDFLEKMRKNNITPHGFDKENVIREGVRADSWA